ncbi:MAG: hypothetical protein ACREQ9_00060, partial [Candidatus Binatia bacterium]
MKRALLFLLLVSTGAVGAGRYVFWLLLERPGPALSAPVRVDVSSGEPFAATAAVLEARGVV